MSNVFDTTPIENDGIECPACGTLNPINALECAECGHDLENDLDNDATPTRPLRHPPAVPRTERAHCDSFITAETVILQFLPSGTCVATQLERPLVLGREYVDTGDGFLSLIDFNGENHGVSRQHCSLRRRGSVIVVTDLGSTNGTHLNGQRLIPHEEYVVTHGDKLVLGSLHLIVSSAS